MNDDQGISHNALTEEATTPNDFRGLRINMVLGCTTSQLKNMGNNENAPAIEKGHDK